MKHIPIIFFSLILFSCGTQKKISESVCPENGICSFEKHENKSLIIKRDGIGSVYHQMEDHKGRTVFVYRYEQNKNADYMDGHYIEEIIFELDDSVFNKSFKNLKPNKILFGVFCYCKGKAGYYSVENASVSYHKKTKKIEVVINEVIENQHIKSFVVQK